MNSVERVRTALLLGQPDRVPIVEFLIDPSVYRAILPDACDQADFMDRMDLDAVACTPDWLRVKENPDGTFVDEWGVTYVSRGPELLSHPVRGPVQTMEDARAYTPPDPDAPHRLETLRDLVRRYKDRRAIIFHHRAEFMWAAYVAGIDNLLAALLSEPEFACLLMDKVLEANMRVAQNAVRAGADVVVLADDYAHNPGPMMSPDVFQRYLLPRLSRMVALIRNEGALCIKHTDGNIYPLLDMLISTGIHGLNPLEPLAGMDLKTVKQLAGGRVCLVGNIDCGELLPHGSPEEVTEAVRRAISDGAAGGGFILSSSNSIHSSVAPRNYVAMLEAARRFGVYA